MKYKISEINLLAIILLKFLSFNFYFIFILSCSDSKLDKLSTSCHSFLSIIINWCAWWKIPSIFDEKWRCTLIDWFYNRLMEIIRSRWHTKPKINLMPHRARRLIGSMFYCAWIILYTLSNKQQLINMWVSSTCIGAIWHCAEIVS